MAGRSRVPSHLLHPRDQQPPPSAALLARLPQGGLPPHHAALMEEAHLRRMHLHQHPHPAIIAMEDRLNSQHREIQALLGDNQRLAATHVALKQELTAAQHQLRLTAATADKVNAERDASLRELFERAAKAEAEFRAIEGMRAELVQVGGDVRKLRASQDELVQRLQGLREELARSRTEAAQAPDIGGEIEAMHREIQRGRAAVEYEKKIRASNIEQSENMEKNIISMAREVEKLRGELDNAEKRARAAAAAAVAANPGQGYTTGSYGSSELGYGGTTYGDAYSLQQAQRAADGSQYGAQRAADSSQYGAQRAADSSQYGAQRVADGGSQYGARNADGGSQYGSGVVSLGPYDMQQHTVR